MKLHRKYLQNRLLQALYRPKSRQNSLISKEANTFFDEIENALDEKVSPLLSDFF